MMLFFLAAAGCSASSDLCQPDDGGLCQNFYAKPAAIVASFPVTEQPSSPTLCTNDNQGRCECANLPGAKPLVAKGHTYTWYIEGTQRCLTTYVGSNTHSNSTAEPQATVLFLQCYGRDRLQVSKAIHSSTMVSNLK